ncbi:TIGR04211 family SH3 domain-containing protein [Acidihalobacter prosperus]|uniref:SH3b domain-containing protein n=1 Tax=Acidihalobacter prosperus TaxID=160660 RepID=A0A1A6C7G4_9GAMM|nr:TIGR04211 family SH3 domain-containing protein [Acidihalobacter prosperus]OBS10489.1 hypothetical protein Thpro_020205 [Acidihalobacter prosperus]
MRLGLTAISLLLATALSAADTASAATDTGTVPDPTSASPASGTLYITDQIKVTLRSGPGLQYQILKMLATGDRVATLKTTGNGYTQVRLGDGSEGWVLSRYLMTAPPAAMRLAATKQQLTQADEALSKSRDSLAQAKTQLSQLEQAKQQLQTQLDSMNRKYQALVATSQQAIALKNINKTLSEQQKADKQRIDILTQANATLSRRANIQWFLAGGGVLLGGLVIGLLLPRIARRRRDNWFS